MSTVIIDGDLREPIPVSSPNISFPISNFTGLKYYKQQFACLSNRVPPPPLGEKHYLYSNAILAEQSGAQSEGAISRFTRTYVEYPSSTLEVKRKDNDRGSDFPETIYEFGLDSINYHFSEPKQLTFTYPEFKIQDSVWYSPNNQSSEVYRPFAERTARSALTTGVMGITTYRFINLMEDKYGTTASPQNQEVTANTQIFYNGSVYKPSLLHSNGDVSIRAGGALVKLDNNQLRIFVSQPSGFDISKIPIKEKWSPRRLQVSVFKTGFKDQYGYDEYDTEPIDTGRYKTKFISTRWTRPTIEEYLEGVSAGIMVRAEPTKIESLIGCIYVVKETLVPLR